MSDFEAKVQFKNEDTAKKVVHHFRTKAFMNRARIYLTKVSKFDGDEYCVIVSGLDKEHLSYAQFFMKGVLWASEVV